MEITSNDFIELSIQHKSKSKDKNTYYVNDEIIIDMEQLSDKPSSKTYFAYCTNYISPTTCKFTNKPCRFLHHNHKNNSIPFYEIIDFHSHPAKEAQQGKSFIFVIPPYCPLYQNKKPNKNMNIIIVFVSWNEMMLNPNKAIKKTQLI